MMYDLIIIGGGPAGIVAGIYAARKKMKSLLITRDFFGQPAKTGQIDNWPGDMGITGIDLMKKFEKHLKEFEIDIKEGREVEEIKKQDQFFSVGIKSKDSFQAKSVIVASGRKPKVLGIPGEKELIGKGVSFCSICDAPFFSGKQVVVAGGGNAGFESALDLAKYAKEIFIIDGSSKPKADELLQEEAGKNKIIKILLGKDLKSIEGKEKVEAVIIEDLLSKEILKIEAKGVFVQIGSSPDTEFIKDLVRLNRAGEIEIDFATCATSMPGIFAAGDVTDIRWKQVIIAAGEGAKAALASYEYLKNA